MSFGRRRGKSSQTDVCAMNTWRQEHPRDVDGQGVRGETWLVSKSEVTAAVNKHFLQHEVVLPLDALFTLGVLELTSAVPRPDSLLRQHALLQEALGNVLDHHYSTVYCGCSL